MVQITLSRPGPDGNPEVLYTLGLDEKGLKDAVMMVRSNMMENPSIRADDDSGDDKVLDVYQTLLIKGFSEEDGTVFLTGTLIQRILNPPEDLEYFPYRINDRSASEYVEVRRIRDGKVFPLKSDNDEKQESKDDVVPRAVATTFNVRFPLSYRKLDGFNYPFNVVEFYLDLEMSSVTINGKQYRPALHVPKEPKDMFNLINIKVKRLKDHNKEEVDGDTEDKFDLDSLDDMVTYDFLRLRPDFHIPKESKGKTEYFPKIKVSFYAEIPWKKNFITSTIPTGLLVAMQWINWYLNIYTHSIEDTYGDYFAAALTIVLATVVLIPMLQDKSTKSGKLSFADYLMVVLFVGTGISSAPAYGLAGSIVSTTSILFIIVACIQYYIEQNKIQNNNPRFVFSDFVLKGKKEKKPKDDKGTIPDSKDKSDKKGKSDKKVSKPKGEDIDLKVWEKVAKEHQSKLTEDDKQGSDAQAKKEPSVLKNDTTAVTKSDVVLSVVNDPQYTRLDN